MRISDWSSDVCSSDLRTEQLQRSIDELTDTIAGRNEKCEALKRETEGLKRDLDGRELPFLYTAVPLASSDMYGPSWRFVARQPSLAGGAPARHPAAPWAPGRPDLDGPLNQSGAGLPGQATGWAT